MSPVNHALGVRANGGELAVVGDAVDYLLPILPYLLLIIACYFMISRNRSRGEAAAFLLAIVAGIPLSDGGMLLFRESGRWQDGRVTSGIVVEKMSTTGEDGTRTIGGHRRVRRSSRVPTVLVRVLLGRQ